MTPNPNIKGIKVPMSPRFILQTNGQYNGIKVHAKKTDVQSSPRNDESYMTIKKMNRWTTHEGSDDKDLDGDKNLMDSSFDQKRKQLFPSGSSPQNQLHEKDVNNLQEQIEHRTCSQGNINLDNLASTIHKSSKNMLSPISVTESKFSDIKLAN